MAKQEKKKIMAIVGAGVALVGLVLAIVGLFLDVLSITMSVPGGGSLTQSSSLSDIAKDGEYTGNTTFIYIAIIVTLVATAGCLAERVLAFMGKDLKVVRIACGAAALVGAILVIVSGFVLAGAVKSDLGILATDSVTIAPAVGIWLAAVGGILGVGSVVTGLLK